jgi:hypothetical protein
MATAIEQSSHAPEVRPGSSRSFGIVFAAVFAIIALWPLIGLRQPRWWALAIAAAFAAIAAVKPDLLAPLNRLWFRFGMLLGRVVSPLVMGAVFFLCVTPTALILRLIGKDVLALRRDREARSYWIMRETPGPAPETMKNQF